MTVDGQPTVRRVRLATGVSLEVALQGDPDGQPVILLHGVTDSWHSFAPLLPHLPPTLRVYALTQRGHGDSDKPAEGYEPWHFAADVAALVDTLDLGAAVVVGHSMGATVAMRFAIDHPERCCGLALAGAFARYSANPDIVEFWRAAIEPLADPVDPGFAREFQLGTISQAVAPAFVDLVVGESLKAPAHVWRQVFSGLMADAIAAEYQRLRVPALLLHGARDALATEQDHQQLLAALADARLQRYESAGHALHWEEPQRFAGDVAAFVASLPRPASRGRPQMTPKPFDTTARHI